MALINEIIKEAKKQKATTVTKTNKAAGATSLANKVNTTTPSPNTSSVKPKVNTGKTSSNQSVSNQTVTNVLNKVKGATNVANKATTTTPATNKGLTANKGYTERLKDLRPQEETSAESKNVIDQLNQIYSARSYGADVDFDTQALEKRRQELVSEQKRQEEKREKVTIPEFQKAYEDAMAKGDKESAKYYSEMVDALDDNTVERVLKSASAAGRNAFADIMGSIEEIKDISYENDALGYEEQYKRALAEGKTEEAEYYRKRAEESRKRADSYDALDDSHWSVQLRNESQHIMELERIGASGTDMLLMEVGDNVANMLPTVALSAVPGVGSFSMAAFVPQVFSATYVQNIKNGYDIQTSASNAALSAAVEFVSEEIGTVTGFAVRNTPGLNKVFSRVMDSNIGRMWGAMMANKVIQDPFSEGNEELFSGLVQPIIDHYTLGTDIEYSFGDLSHAWIMGALTSVVMNSPEMISTHINTSKQANFLKAELAMIEEASGDAEYAQANNMARRITENALAEFREKSITADAIKLESEQAEVPSVNELLAQYAEFMKPTEDAYQKKMQESVEKVNAIEQQRLHEKGVDIDAGVWALLDSKTKTDILSLTEKNLDIDYGDYITHDDAKYRQAMVDIAESNALLSVENKTGKFNTELFASLPSETQDSIKKLSSKFNKGTSPSVAFGFFTGNESGMNAKYDKANNAIVVNLNQTRAIDVDALADIADEAYTDIKNAGVNEIFYKSGFASTFANAVAHEFTHSAEGTTEYDKVVELARSEMGADRYERAKSRLNEYYESRNADPGDNSEIVAHYIQKNVDSKDFMEKLYKYNDSAFYRIYDNMLSLVSGNEKTKLENALRKAIYKANNPSDSFAMQYSTGLALNPEYQASQNSAEKAESQYSSGTAKRITDINDPQYYTRSNLELRDPIEVKDYPKSNQRLSGKTDVKSFFDTMITNAINSGATEFKRGKGAYFDVSNNDTGHKVGVTDRVVNEAIAHRGNTFVTSSLLNLNPLLENAVLVNKTTNGTDVFDVYFTHAKFSGNDTLIRIIAKNSTVVDVDSMAYAVSTSKGDSALVTKNSTLPSSGKKNGGVFDTITIANLLQEVNGTRFKGNLSKDVQSKLNNGVVIPNPDPRYTNLYSIGIDSGQKQTQFDILQSANPMADDYHTGIRSVDDIHTFEEVNQSMEDVTPDFTADDIRQAIDDGYVTVYSSNPIQNGTFVTPSLMEAKNYAGDGRIYSQRVNLDQVAWIDSVEGQYADTSNYAAEQVNKEEVDLKPLTPEQPYNISKNTAQFSVGMYEHGGREVLEDYIKGNPDIDGGEDIVKRVDEIAQVMKDFAETGRYPSFSKWQDQYYAINEKGELSVVISNGDYDLNIDFSTVCKKRKMMDKVINRLSESGYLDATLKPAMIAEVRKTIQEHGMEVACGLCFVDAKRFNQGNWAGRFESKWNGLIDQLAGLVDTDDVRTFDYVRGQTEPSESLANIDFSDPKFAEFVEKSKGGSEEAKMARALINDPSLRAYVSKNDMYGSKGFTSIRDNNPELYKLVNASGGSSKPKLAHGEVNFRNEIILDNGFNEQAAREVGGVRFQSFSDFMTNMVFDYVQAFSELEAKNLPAHSYTKVKEYALLFGKTGMKINLSIIPAAFDSNAYTAEQIADMRKNDKRSFNQLRENAGLDADGNYIFDPESFDWDLAVEISNLDGYDKNVGTICVGVSYNHIVKMLGDDNVQMVIPYHRSGINPIVADKMGISLYNDYTLKQNTRFRKENGKPGKKIGKSFDFDFYKGKDANGKHYPGMIELGYDAKAATNSYLQWCEESNYVPKFDEFAWHENYYKLLIDFRAYDKYGNVAPQEAVKISGDNFGSFDGEIRPTDIIDPSVNPALAKLYGDNISFNNVLQHGLDLNEGIEYEQDSQLDTITNEVIEKLNLKQSGTSNAEENIQYSLAVDPNEIEFLNNQDHVKVYRAMALIDGKLYPPMATKVKNAETGKYELQEPTEIGKWYRADERPDLIDPKTGKYKLKKDEGTDVNAAYNPYWHTSLSVLNDQFTSAYKRPNLVVVEGEVPVSELTSGYRAQFAKDPVGKTEWHSGTVSSDLKKAGKNAREVILSRWFRPISIVSDVDVAKGISDMVAGTGVEIPFNVVTPSVRSELEKLGVPIGDSRGLREVLSKDVSYSIGISDSQGRKLSNQQREYFKDSKAVDENGNLLTLYHGTPRGGFSVFDSSFSDDKRSLFFTDDPEVADTYNGGRNKGSIYPVYLNLKNPLVIDAKGAWWNSIQNGESESYVVDRKNLGDFGFTRQADYDKFNNKYHLEELNNLYKQAQENGTAEYKGREVDEIEAWELLDDATAKAEKEYSKYFENNSKLITPRELFENPKNYGWYDLYNLESIYDPGGWSFDEMKEDAEIGYSGEPEGLLENAIQHAKEYFESEIEEGNLEPDFMDSFMFSAIPKTGETTSERDLHNTRWFSEQAQKQGYDGVIFKNLVDRASGDGASTIAVAYDSNQVKSIFNSNPTSNKDIRYSMGLTNQQKDFVSEGIKPSQTERLKSGKIPAKVGRILQKTYDAFDSNYSNTAEQFGLRYDDVSDYLLEAASEISKTGGMSEETLNNLYNVMYQGATEVYNLGDRDADAYTKVKDILKSHPLERNSIKELKLSKENVKDMRKNGIRFAKDGYDLGELENIFNEAGLNNFDERSFSDLEDFNKSLSDLRLSEGNTHPSSDSREFQEEFDKDFDKFFEDTMKTFVSDITGKQIMSDQAAEVIDSLDIPDEEFYRFVRRDPISKRAEESILKHKQALVDTAQEWIPNYDIIQEKHPEFTQLELNDALFEILQEGTLSERTSNRLKEKLLEGLSVSDNEEANLAINELVNDSIDYFKADAAYKMDKKAMNSVANKANTIIRSFTGQQSNMGEGALESYEQMNDLEKSLKAVKKRRAEVSAKIESMVKDLIASGKDFGSEFMTLEQILDKIAGTNSDLRQTLRDYFELPKYESQMEYVRFKKKYGDTLQGFVKDGIRAGTKESAAVQYMLEGHTETGAKYGQKELMEQFPDSWQKLDKAAQTLRQMYDEMYEQIETNREKIYGDIDAKYDLQLAKARDKANNARRAANEIKQKLSQKADARLEAMYNRADAEASKLERQYDQMVKDKGSRDNTRRQKLQYRKNYAHHLSDSGNFFKWMKDVIANERSVPTKLSGISDRAKPLSGFASFFQSQNKQKNYVADAIGGMAEYINEASKIYAYDPYIEYLRFAASDIRAEASGNEMSRFVEYLDDYANGIAGKTQAVDRVVRKAIGERGLKILKKLNSKAKQNAIVGNLSTALVQFANLPNAIGVLGQYGGAESSLDIARGMAAYMSHLGQDGAESASPFMSARYYDIDTQKGNVFTRSANAFTKALLEFGDHEAAKMIWNSAYQQGLRLNVDDPIMYADDLTRRSIAGREVGELPLALQAQFVNLALPFQVETNNTLHIYTGLMRDKKLGSLLAMLVGGWLMNGLYEAIIGRRPIVDPIDAIVDGIQDGEDPVNIGTRLVGELLSAIPGSQYIPAAFNLNDNQRKKFFGDNDPTRYGTGNIGLSTFGSVGMDLFNAYQNKDNRYVMNAVSDLASTYLAPGGGRQIQRSVEGLQSEGMIPQYVNGEWVNEPRYYTPSGKVGFVNDPSDIFDVITAGTFGRWATKAGKEYLENGSKYLSDQATRQLEALGGDQNAYNAVIAMRDMQGIPGVDNSKALQKRKYLEDQGLWDTFAENMDGEWGDYGLNKTVGNASEEEFNKLYQEVFGGDSMKLSAKDVVGESKALDNLASIKGSPFEKAAIESLDMDEDVLRGVTDLGYDYQTIKQIDDYIDNTDSLRKDDGSAIRNTKALQMRQYYEEMGVYDDIFQYISENGLDPQDYGLNKTVMGYSDSKFESQYSKYYGGGSSGSSSKSSSKSSKSSSKSSSKKSSKSKGMTEDEQRAFFEKLVANISTGKSTSSTINSILKKSKKLRKSKGNNYEGLQDLIKSYYKSHPGADKSMFS